MVVSLMNIEWLSSFAFAFAFIRTVSFYEGEKF